MNRGTGTQSLLAENRSNGQLFEWCLGRSHALSCWLYLPRRKSVRRLLVSVHGISRNREAHLDAFRTLADCNGTALLLPLFDRIGFPGYQRLGVGIQGVRADIALLDTVDQVGRILGLDFSRFDLFGFSGGAQFAHRLALLHPQRVGHLGLGSAGWYSWPDESLPYPLGMGLETNLQGGCLDLPAFLTKPISVWVGDEDVRRNTSLNTRRRIELLQGATRRQRAINWVQAMRRAALRHGITSRVRLTILPGVGHDFDAAIRKGDLADRIFNDFL